jgi:hypothetical protein
MLNKLQIRTQLHITTVTILTASTSPCIAFTLWPPLALHLSWGRLTLLQLFQHHGVRHAALDTDQRQTQKNQSRDDSTINRTKKPIQAMGALARFGHDDSITRGHHDFAWLPQMRANEQPLQATPTHRGIEKALDRPITPAFASPARQAYSISLK